MPNSSSEHDIQAVSVSWFKQNYPDGVLFSVPNEATHTRSYYFQASGMLKGAADIVVIMHNLVIFFEFKTKYHYQSPEQIEFQRGVEVNGFQYYVVRSLEEFQYRIKHAYGPFGIDGRPLDYMTAEDNLNEALGRETKRQKKMMKIKKQGLEAGV